MEIMMQIFENSSFTIPITCLCVVFLFTTIIIFIICCRQRRKVKNLMRKVEVIEKNAEYLEQKPAIPVTYENADVVKESQVPQVWESDECVFYDLGKVSRGVSREVLDDIEVENETIERQESIKEGTLENGHQADMADDTKQLIEQDLGIGEPTSVACLEDSKLNGASLDQLTDEIWSGDTKQGSNEKLSINDALSDISDTRVMEDSGNETISNDDMLCHNGDGGVSLDENKADDQIADQENEENQ